MSCVRLLLPLLLSSTISSAIPDPATFSICSPRYSYNQQVNSIHEIDFRNFNLVIYANSGKKRLVAILRNGLFQRDYPSSCHDWLKLTSIVYFDDEIVASQKALIRADYVSACGSSTDHGIVQVFEIADGHPVVIQQIEYNERGDGAGTYFSVKTGILRIKSVHGWEHCCPKTLDVGTFKWNGSRFDLVKTASIPMPTVN